MQSYSSKNSNERVESRFVFSLALHSYAKHLGQTNADLAEEIKRENIKTREIIFTYLSE